MFFSIWKKQPDGNWRVEYRQRKMPFMGKEAVRAWLLGSTSHDEVTVKTIGADVAASGDLGYSLRQL